MASIKIEQMYRLKSINFIEKSRPGVSLYRPHLTDRQGEIEQASGREKGSAVGRYREKMRERETMRE